jgi:hypothetical protein
MLTEEYKGRIKNFYKRNENEHVGFVYVPKTGGTYLSISFIPQKYHGPKYKLSKLASSFHMPASRVVDIVGNETPLFTMVRDPYDRSCSEYYFIKRRILSSIDSMHWDFSDEKKLNFVINRVESVMGSDIYSKKIYQIFKNNLNIEEYLEWYHEDPTYPWYYDIKTPKDFDIVGLTEDIPGTISLLKNIYDIDVSYGDANDNPLKKVNKPYKTKYSRRKFKKHNDVEYNLYYEGKEKYHKILSQTKTS